MGTTSQITDILPAGSRFLASGPVQLFIGGEWVDAADGGRFTTCHPGTGEVLAEVAEGTARDIHRAVQAAGKAFRETKWAAMPAPDRAVILHRLADLVDAHASELAQNGTLEVRQH